MRRRKKKKQIIIQKIKVAHILIQLIQFCKVFINLVRNLLLKFLHHLLVHHLMHFPNKLLQKIFNLLNLDLSIKGRSSVTFTSRIQKEKKMFLV